jgi:hypothetical protein
MGSYLCLDVDGVLNSEEYFHRRDDSEPWPLSDLDAKACKFLDRMVDRLGVEIILSSTWRHRGLGQVSWLLEQKGFFHPFIGKTPNIGPVEAGSEYTRSETQRGLEIEWCLLENVPRADWQDIRLVILDDDSDMGRLKPWLVHTAWERGLLPEHEEKVVEALSRPLGDLLYTPNPLWTPETLKFLGL